MASFNFSDDTGAASSGDPSSHNALSGEHLLKTTKIGRPFHKDTADIFATFAAAIELKPHRFSFRTYNHSFTTDEAIQTLSTLKFSQSTRTPDPADPIMFITTTTNFLFSMTPSVAMNLGQHFMDARYIQNAIDPTLNLFKDRSIHSLTPKGLYMLERFIHKTGVDADHLQRVLDTEIMCTKLFHLQRGSVEDEIIFRHNGIIGLFRWFVGQHPNYPPKSAADLEPLQQYTQRSKGITVMDFIDRNLLGKSILHELCFDAVEALEWLCDFTSVVGREEAAEVMAHFDRLGLISLVGNPDKSRRKAIIFTVHGPVPKGDITVRSQGDYRCVNKAAYQVTAKGCRLACWTEPDGDGYAEKDSKETYVEGVRTSEDSPLASASDPASRLRYILKEQAFRSLFREFLAEKFCEEHVMFWMDVEAITRKFNVTSSAIAGADVRPDQQSSGQVRADRRRHQLALLQKAFVIYKTYLEPASQYELNTDYSLRNELVKFLDTVPTTEAQVKGRDKAAHIMFCNAEQLQMLIRHYKQIQAYTFRVMLTDSLPKFIETEKYLALQTTFSDVCRCPDSLRAAETDDSLELGGAYITYSSFVR